MQVIIAHIVAASDRYIVDGLVGLSGLILQIAGGGARRLSGNSTQQYITAAVAGLLVIIWILI